MTQMARIALLTLGLAMAVPAVAGAQGARTKDEWVALARGGFVLAGEQRAVDVLLEMNPLLSSPDPVLRDEVAFSAAERWILRDKLVDAAGLRRLMDQWSRNLAVGLGESGTDSVFGRSFSALCLSLIAAADLQASFLEAAEVESLFGRMLDYFAKERDVRGFDPARGWMHSVAHTADVLKFLARNRKLGAGVDRRLLDAVRAKILAADTVFTWGENDRMALALQSAVRRDDAIPAALDEWTAHWVEAHRALWSGGPQVNPRTFAQTENARQVMRSLYAALAMEAAPTANGTASAKAVLTALAKMR